MEAEEEVKKEDDDDNKDDEEEKADEEEVSVTVEEGEDGFKETSSVTVTRQSGRVLKSPQLPFTGSPTSGSGFGLLPEQRPQHWQRHQERSPQQPPDSFFSGSAGVWCVAIG